jgi:protein arginine kinase activator
MDARCAVCGAKAERQFTEIVGGQRRSRPLCLECAGKQDFTAHPPVTPKPKIHVKIQAQLAGQGLPPVTLRCPECGMRLVELRRSGRVGCAACYETFRQQILPLLRRVHGAVEHTGARPADASAEPDLGRLREELRRAIEAEDFEQAARIRDRIGAEHVEDEGDLHE